MALSEEGLYDEFSDCEPGVDCPVFADENALARMEEILAQAYEAQEEQGSYDPWRGTRDFLEWGDAREDNENDIYDADDLADYLEEELDYKERELAMAKRAHEREKQQRH